MLMESRFSFVWENLLSIKYKKFILTFKQRLLDNFIQGCLDTISKSPLHLHNHMKNHSAEGAEGLGTKGTSD